MIKYNHHTDGPHIVLRLSKQFKTMEAPLSPFGRHSEVLLQQNLECIRTFAGPLDTLKKNKGLHLVTRKALGLLKTNEQHKLPTKVNVLLHMELKQGCSFF